MVDRHGTDDIPIRVSHLESSVERLHADNQRTQHTLAGVVAQLDSQGRILSDIAEKLDGQRTRRPDMPMILTVAIMAVGLIGTIGGFALAPVYREMSASAKFHEAVTQTLIDRSAVIGNAQARISQLEESSRHTNDRLLNVESNRFSKQDGDQLRRDIDEKIETLRGN